MYIFVEFGASGLEQCIDYQRWSGGVENVWTYLDIDT